ncbi:hypothetical protein [Clostridium tyrobutyricum]|uniref:hypothetical protein n=1 Tax=Clostridium tyrobutyricum TaxID=1519 RepID=UPI001C3889AF|nr:hypothetical protein [Clostridium tyrobutyricum]MBV4417481.1 hypothetical protein [Clostridium tyrobutyricum]MBV4423089.1 hypothetical protein [Clostridium tyrobutyricum]
MNKDLRDAIRTVKELQRKELLYMSDDIGLKVEPNYQMLASIIEDVDLSMGKEYYDKIKNNSEDLIYELVMSSFKDDDFISEADIELMEYIIKKYIDVKAPFLFEDTYMFNVKMDKLQNLYEKALKQIKEGKFKNYLF